MTWPCFVFSLGLTVSIAVRRALNQDSRSELERVTRVRVTRLASIRLNNLRQNTSVKKQKVRSFKALICSTKRLKKDNSYLSHYLGKDAVGRWVPGSDLGF